MTYTELNQNPEKLKNQIKEYITSAISEYDNTLLLEDNKANSEYQTQVIEGDEAFLIEFKKSNTRTREVLRPWVARIKLDIEIGIKEGNTIIPFEKIITKEDLLAKFQVLVDERPELAAMLLERY